MPRDATDAFLASSVKSVTVPLMTISVFKSPPPNFTLCAEPARVTLAPNSAVKFSSVPEIFAEPPDSILTVSSMAPLWAADT